MNKELDFLEKEIKDLEIKLEKDIKLRDKLNVVYQHNTLENCVNRISKYEYKLKQLNSTKQLLETKSKKELAFDIIKEKEVDIPHFYDAMTLGKEFTFVYYKKVSKYYSKEELTQEEFDLLKEML